MCFEKVDERQPCAPLEQLDLSRKLYEVATSRHRVVSKAHEAEALHSAVEPKTFLSASNKSSLSMEGRPIAPWHGLDSGDKKE